jgi:hypothetical protein
MNGVLRNLDDVVRCIVCGPGPLVLRSRLPYSTKGFTVHWSRSLVAAYDLRYIERCFPGTKPCANHSQYIYTFEKYGGAIFKDVHKPFI